MMDSNFKGLIATYLDGTKVLEKNFFYSDKMQKECATNWHEIDLTQVESLELYFDGSLKARVSKRDTPDLTPKDWFFSHTGISDMGSDRPKTITRNIGYRKEGLLYVTSVDEATGAVTTNLRKE